MTNSISIKKNNKPKVFKKAVILNDTSSARHHGCKIVMKNISQLLLKNEIRIININPYYINWEKNAGFIESMLNSDIVIVNGEGTLHHSQPEAKSLVRVAKYVKENLNIPVVLINSTIQDNDGQFYNDLKYFNLIYTRESLSRGELLKYNISSTVVPDLSFYTKHDFFEKTDNHLIGVTDSVFWDLSQELYKLSENKNHLFLPIVTPPSFCLDDIESILPITKYYFIKVVASILIKFHYPLKYGHARILFYKKNYEKYINQISNLNFLVVGRYHSLCFALKTLTPFIAILSNSFKMEGVLSDIGIIERLRSFDELSVEDYKPFSTDDSAKIASYINQAPKKIEDMFSDISELIT